MGVALRLKEARKEILTMLGNSPLFENHETRNDPLDESKLIRMCGSLYGAYQSLDGRHINLRIVVKDYHDNADLSVVVPVLITNGDMKNITARREGDGAVITIRALFKTRKQKQEAKKATEDDYDGPYDTGGWDDPVLNEIRAKKLKAEQKAPADDEAPF